MKTEDERGHATRIFLEARDVSLPERPRFLERACGSNTELRRDVESLLQHDAERAVPADPQPPEIPGYEIVRLIGEGGMGEVWLAHQMEPVRREVAIKVIKAGMDTRQVIARFEAERQALAMMNHPSIAKVFDAGATSRGLPYFAMDYVEGEPITRYADRARLGIETRLDLFVEVCEAITHAHQKGVIHRDLKPSNILVTRHGDRAIPTIIDFGLAKATAFRLTEEPITRHGSAMGTPEYMSPEQAGSTLEEVDTRTDLYSLGVVLYELMTGVLPWEHGSIDLSKLLHRVREIDPPTPSARVMSLATPDRVRLRRRLRGDIDWITMRALEKDRSRRYQSVSELAADIGRHRRGEVVLAGPPSVRYRLGKFVRRHRWGVAATALIAAILVGSAAALAIQNLRVTRALDLAEERGYDSNAVMSFLSGILSRADPLRGGKGTMTVKDAIDFATEATLRDQARRPSARGMIGTSIGRIQLSLGNYAKAETLLKSAIENFRNSPRPDGVEYADAVLALANVENFTGRPAEALPHLQEALAIRERELGPKDLKVAEVLADLGDNTFASGEVERSRGFYQRSLAIEREAQPDKNPRIPRRLMDLGDVSAALEDFPGAARYYEEVRTMLAQRHRTESLEYAVLENNLGEMYIQMERWAEARPALEEALALSEKIQGPNHPEIAHTLCLLGRVEAHDDKPDEAERLYRRALKIAGSDDVRKTAQDGLTEVAGLRGR